MSTYRRLAEPILRESLTDTPLVLIHGPRQCGKTTLAQLVGQAAGYTYFTFDDKLVLAAATADPIGFVADLPNRTILDEVQWAPEIFSALQLAVDRQRTPGRFLLTGSSNVLLVPQLSDSLAGRMGILRLHPLSRCELANGQGNFISSLFNGGGSTEQFERLGDELVRHIVAGGYPDALARSSGHRRAAWYRDYLETIVQRDVRDLRRVQSLDALPRLLTIAAGQTAQLTDLASPFELSRPTIRGYLTLLASVFLLEELPAWHSNRISRLIKTPKLHVGDTGLACALLGLDIEALKDDRKLLGHLLETFVFQELRRQSSGLDEEIRFYHYRNRDKDEVDILIERGGQLVGIEVKASSTIRSEDFKGLRKLRAALGTKLVGGFVLYDGELSVGFGEGLRAVPIRAMWERA